MQPSASVLPLSVPMAATQEADNASTSLWFKTEVLPLESKLRAFLRFKFPHIADLDDLIQETYLRVFKNHAAGRMQFTKAYLFTVARNIAVDSYRRDRVARVEPLGDPEELSVLDNGPDAAEHACQDQEIELLAEAVRDLPEKCRRVVTLRKIYGLSHQEIAAKLGISERTAMAHMNHGIVRMREYMIAHGVYETSRP